MKIVPKVVKFLTLKKKKSTKESVRFNFYCLVYCHSLIMSYFRSSMALFKAAFEGLSPLNIFAIS